jgi:hypothetical protein|nr:MAG TPA: Head Tail Connector Protein [Caudoviricetes sp.]
MYVDYAFYKNLYGTTVDDKVFNRLIWNAEKLVKNAVTGVDGRCKLDFAFPDVAYDAEAVKRCECALVNIMAKIEKAETEAEGNKTVKSVSAGNESISYDTGSGLIGKVLSDKSAQSRLYADTINEYLRGTKDKNGVNLLFGGAYPFYYTEV